MIPAIKNWIGGNGVANPPIKTFNIFGIQIVLENVLMIPPIKNWNIFGAENDWRK